MQPHLDNVDITFDKPKNIKICIKFQSLWYNVALANTEAIRVYQSNNFIEN